MTLVAGDAVASQIASGSWTSGAPTSGGGASPCSSIPGFPGPLAGFVRPLEELLDMFTGEPAAVYGASRAWEQTTGDVADVYVAVRALADEVGAQLQGLAAAALEEALRVLSSGANSVANWTKSVSQGLQLCVTIFETIRSMVCEALELLSDFVDTIGDVIFGSWPWEIGKKVAAVQAFADSVDEFVQAIRAAADNALQAARELVRLLTDLYRAIIPFHEQIEQLLGRIVSLVPGGTAPPVPTGASTGPGGAIYNPSHTPYPGSDLEIQGDYPLGYQHTYDLGATGMTTEQLNQMFRDEFGHLFVPCRVGDNSQLNMQLTSVGQTINTSLFGLDIPSVTSGEIVVQQITSDGFVIAASPGHPEYPGEVAFHITNVDGHAQLQVTGAYNDTILGRHDLGAPIDSNPAYAVISDKSIWADMQGRLSDRLAYG